jgi:cyclophilin family peptidyl-prolyl cis-trans isomerase
VPSAKRERIRANQARVRAEREAIKKKNNRKRRSITVAVAVVVVIGVVYFINRSNNASSTKKLAAGATLTAAQASVTCPPINGSTQRITHFTQAPPMCISTNKTYVATVKTDVGTFKIKLDPKTAPLTTNNFVFLARYRFFDGIIFHRVIPGFVVQGGDPTGTGTGGPGYTFKDELPKAGAYKIGSVAMANSGPNTNGSQFFIVVGPSGEQLPPSYSLFGQVVSGMNVVQKIASDGSASGTPKVVHHMISVTISQS